jgi:hypothetical protein
LDWGNFHPVGAMAALQTVLPFKLAATEESLTAHSGLALIGEYLRAMGVRELIDHELPRPGSAARYEPSAHILPVILMLAGSASFSVAGEATTATSARAEALDQHDRTWLA